MDLLKITTIIEWPLPKSIRKILSFLGFCNFYRRFILVYSEIILLMTNLIKNKIKFDWSKDYKNAFSGLKELFTKTLLLNHWLKILIIFLEKDVLIRALYKILFQK